MATDKQAPGPVDDRDTTVVDGGVGVPDRLIRLWAPYRMDYIVNNGGDGDQVDKGTGNKDRDPFLKVPTMSDEDGLIVARGETVFCVLNLFPYNAGHMMIIPYRKVANLEDLSEAESGELMLFAQTAIKVVKKVSAPDAINAGFNLGRASGGSVGDHLHMHIVPRWTGDANFMTVIDGTKVLPQALRATRELLARAWAADPANPGVARA
ncbi:HIT family protein [Corynebacterium mendelii]